MKLRFDWSILDLILWIVAIGLLIPFAYKFVQAFLGAFEDLCAP